jgi:hypothetical protein
MSVQSGQTWNSRWRYVVQEVTDEGVRVSGYNGYGHFCGDRILEPSIWTSEGAVVEDGPGRSHRLWMLPEGNVR